jgi:hypothetical protein
VHNNYALSISDGEASGYQTKAKSTVNRLKLNVNYVYQLP